MARVAIAVAVFALTLYALVDCSQTDDDRMRGLPKIVWMMIILFVVVVGPVAWLLLGRPPRRPPPRPGRTDGPRGPEDDPDFLRNL